MLDRNFLTFSFPGYYINLYEKCEKVLPVFYARGKTKPVAPNHHIDLSLLSQLISISGADISETTGETWTFKGGSVIGSRLKSQMNWQHVPNDFFNEMIHANFGKIKPVPTENMKNIFNKTSKVFASMEHPIRNTAVVYDIELRREIIRATPRPRYIREIATGITKAGFQVVA